MHPCKPLQYASSFLLVMALLLACPQFLSAQSNKKNTNPSPPPSPPPQKPAAPAAAQKPTGKPTQPTGKPTQPTGKPTQPTGKPTQPSGPYAPRPGELPKDLPGGRKEFSNPNGQIVITNARGQVQRIEVPRGMAGRMVVNRVPGGGRVVETGRPGNRVVSYGPHRGFVEHPLRAGYISRTYVRGGHSYAYVYREYHFRNAVYYRYVPAYYYGPGFYAWAVTPWGVPVRYAWSGLATPAPWFGFYAGYFTPYPTYASPDLWLTDYLLQENLRLAYESQQAENPDQSPASPDGQTAAALSPDIKAMIADEVKQQLGAEREAARPASSPQPSIGAEPLPPAMSQRFFVVTSSLDLTTAAGESCSLTPGDILQRKGKEVTADGGVAAEVVSSKPGNCAADSQTTVQLTALQDMQNQMREQLDSGLKMMADNQSKAFPSAPAAGGRAVPEGTAVPAPDAVARLAAQDTDAAKVEAQVSQTGSGGN
jgi:hypothetical protein